MKEANVLVLNFLLTFTCVGQVIPDLSFYDEYLGKGYMEIVNRFGESDTCYLDRKRIKYEGSQGDTLEGKYYFIESSKEDLKRNQEECYYNSNLGLRIRFKEGRSESVTFLKKKYKTIKGVRVGDSKRKLRSKHGSDYEVTYYLRDKYPDVAVCHYYPKLGLRFYFDYYKKNKIVEIQFKKEQ